MNEMTNDEWVEHMMKAARGIPASRFARIVNRVTKGYNWIGCGKRHILTQLVSSTYRLDRYKGPIERAVEEDQKLRTQTKEK